jgi:CPA1 family monovalent cation:H+ antiporter
LTLFQTTALLLTLAALAAYGNYKFIRLPRTIGLMAITLAFSLALVVLGFLDIFHLKEAALFVQSIDFSGTLLHGMLAFLLFAGALHVDLDELKSQALPVAVLSTLGVVFATAVTGLMLWAVSQWIGIGLPWVYAFLFGAMISPTDPIAVLGILKNVGASKSLATKIAGESLFNDGVGIVVFLTILDTALGRHRPEFGQILGFMLKEAAGGVLLGLLLGWIFYRLLKSVDMYQVEILLTLSLAAGGYSLAEALHVSAPITIVVAGLFIGNHGRAFAMSEETRENLDRFWELMDEVLNAVLFALIGLEVLAIDLKGKYLLIALSAILIVLAARFASVATLITAMRFARKFSKGVIRILTWGGLRGGISIALALSLPAVPERQVILTTTYVVVVFSVLVQGLTVGKVVAFLTHAE